VEPAGLAPPKRSWQRGPERRAQLAEVAARQFCRHGFHQVSVADVATAVGLTAPAIYRHYRSKDDLLAAAIGSGLDLVSGTLADVADAPAADFLPAAAGVAIERRDLWILLQREMRHLSPERRQPLENRFSDEVARPFRALVRRERPDLPAQDIGLVATAVLASLASPSVYRNHRSVREQQPVLAAAAQAACQARWGPAAGPASPAGPPPARAADRGAEVLDTAIRLFAARGYQAVSLDDIGAELGLAGPSLYYYYATKADILVAALTRAAEWLAVQREGAASLAALVAAYAGLALRERLLFAVYVAEAVSLPPEAGRRIRAGLHADVQAWCGALGELRPELTGSQRLILVHAARAVVHDAVRIGSWHDRPDLAAALEALATAVLTAPLERPRT
jgi:AcrR family transcriptional regulator